MIVFSEEALADLERIFEFNLQCAPASAFDHIEKVRSAVLILDAHPEIGRTIGRGPGLRELVISHGRSGYVAPYEYSPVEELIRVVAVRHRSEAGYRES